MPVSDFDLVKPLLVTARQLSDARKALQKAETERGAQAILDTLRQNVDMALQKHRELAENTLRLRGVRNKQFARGHSELAADYEPPDGLFNAVNVALSLGRPLLLTGEPGCGKTSCAHWLAHVLGGGELLQFNVKSESRAKDLLYSFDAVSWFRESQIGGEALKKDLYLEARALGYAFGWDDKTPELPRVVLVDEIDKAPRDFPNDLLHELDQMSFRIEEINNKIVACPPDKRPVIVITSNSERQLPTPFLRRCVVHNIVLDDGAVQKILQARLQALVGDNQSLWKEGAAFWMYASSKASLERKVTIDEFWRWLALAILHGDKSTKELASALGKRQATNLPYVRTIFSERDFKSIFDGQG